MGSSGPAQQVASLRWTPWYARLVTDRCGILWFWPVIQDVCQLPDPQALPPLEYQWAPEQAELMMRYAVVSRRLVGSTAFQSDGRVRVSLIAGTVEKVVPADDVSAGFAALLRLPPSRGGEFRPGPTGHRTRRPRIRGICGVRGPSAVAGRSRHHTQRTCARPYREDGTKSWTAD